MSLLANNLIVLLYLQICCLQDNSSAEGVGEGRGGGRGGGGVEGRNGIHLEGLSLHGAKKKIGLV